MTNTEFKTKLISAFNDSILRKNRNKHTVNELLYELEHHPTFSNNDYNISVKTMDGRWLTIPTLEAFVDVGTRAMWFRDDDIEFEVDDFEFDEEIIRVNCLTVYECEKN